MFNTLPKLNPKHLGYVTVLLAVGMTWGCSGAEMVSTETSQNATTNGKADGDLEKEPAPVPALSPFYLLHLDAALSVSSQLAEGETVDYSASLTGIVENMGTGSEIVMDLYPCKVQLPDIDGRKVNLPNETVQKLDPVTIFGKLEHGENETITLRTNATAIVAGANLADALQDPLPEDKEDALVDDVDLDQRPGMTVTISGVKVYTSMRMTFNLDGQLGEENALEGDAVLGLDFEVYGDSSVFVNAQAAAEKAVDQLEVLSQEHRFKMTALPGGGQPPSCEALGFSPSDEG